MKTSRKVRSLYERWWRWNKHKSILIPTVYGRHKKLKYLNWAVLLCIAFPFSNREDSKAVIILMISSVLQHPFAPVGQGEDSNLLLALTSGRLLPPMYQHSCLSWHVRELEPRFCPLHASSQPAALRRGVASVHCPFISKHQDRRTRETAKGNEVCSVLLP